LYLLAFVFTNLVHQSILELTGVDCSEISKDLAISNLDPRYAFPQLMEIFPSDKEFNEFQNLIFNRVNTSRREKIALFCGFLLMTLVHFSDRDKGKVHILADDPYWVDSTSLVSIIITILQIFTQSLLAAGTLSGLFLILVVVRAISNLTEIGTVLTDLSEFTQANVGVGQTNHVQGKYSLNSFKQKANIIPQSLLPIILIIFLIIFLSGSGILYYTILRGGDLVRTYATVLFMIIFISIDVFLFFYPQFSIHQILKQSKNELIEIFDRTREEKKMLFISQKSNLTLDKKQDLWIDIKYLKYLIDELHEFLTWPFNYRQLMTLLFSIIVVTLLIFNIFSFLELVSRIIEE
jgi:hypothetical protein